MLSSWERVKLESVATGYYKIWMTLDDLIINIMLSNLLTCNYINVFLMLPFVNRWAYVVIYEVV